MKQLTVVFASFLIACNTQNNTIQKTKLESYLDSFTVAHKVNGNEIIKKEAAKMLENELPGKVDEGILTDTYLKLGSIEPYGDQYLAHFSFDDKNIDNGYIQLKVNGVIDRKAVDTLQEGELYRIEGKDTEVVVKGIFKIESVGSFVSADLSTIQTNVKQIIPYPKE